MSLSRYRPIGVLLFSLLILLGSCAGEVGEKTSEEKTLASKGKYGGVLTTNRFQDFSTLFPPNAYESSAAQVGCHVYETLMMYTGRDHSLTPCLASEWEVNEAATRYVFTIRDDVYFHDDACFEEGKGRKLSAEDVLFCLRRLCSDSPDSKNAWLFLRQVKGAQEYHDGADKEADIPGISLTDEGRIAIELLQPNAEFIHVLAHYGTSIYPTEMVEKYTRSLSFNPVGTGPFKKKLIRPGEVVIFERNENYWGKSKSGEPLPYLDGIKISFETDARPVGRALEKGTLDAVIDGDMQEGGDAFSDMVALQSAKYRSDGQLDYEVIYCGFLNDHGVFKDKLVRQAFNLAIDKKMIADMTLKGSGYPGIYGIVPPAFTNFPTRNVHGYEFDVVAAKSLLAEAGYADGTDFPVVTLQIQNRYKDVIVAQEIQKQLLDHLNVTISISAVPRANHFERIENRQAEFWLDSWTADFLDPQNFLALFLSTNTPEVTGSYLNTYRYSDARFDSLLDKAVSLHEDKERMRLYSMADSTMMASAAILPVYYEKTMLVAKSNINGLSTPVMGRLDLREVYLDR